MATHNLPMVGAIFFSVSLLYLASEDLPVGIRMDNKSVNNELLSSSVFGAVAVSPESSRQVVCCCLDGSVEAVTDVCTWLCRKALLMVIFERTP